MGGMQAKQLFEHGRMDIQTPKSHYHTGEIIQGTIHV
jgi:hypothetical protein